jgi:signal peptidase II
MFKYSETPQPRNYFWLLLSVIVICLDQITKAVAVGTLSEAGTVPVTSFFNFTLLFNHGAAFSFLSNAGGWQQWLFNGISIGVSAYLLFLIPQLRPHHRRSLAALSLIVGGAIGNLWDRITLGYVIDFLHFHWSSWHFAVFNVADAAITVGAGLLLLNAIKRN